MDLRRHVPLLLLLGIAGGCVPAGPEVGGPRPEPPRRAAEEPAREPEPPAEERPAVLGVVLPLSGSPYLKQYADLVLEGVQLAVEEGEQDGRSRVELVVLDDGGDPARASALVRELESRGAVAVIGPVLSAGVAAAAGARSDASLALLSPTASEVPAGQAHVYSLNVSDEEGGVALAEYAVATGLRRVALLYPRLPDFERQARAFAAALRARGGQVVADVPYDSGTTTFEEPLKQISESSPDAIYVPAPERDVRQIAPQIEYYGVRQLGVQVLGGEAWTREEVRRLVDPRYLEGVVAATPLLQTSSEVGWREFVSLYEQRYRRTLDNPFPALGYDATRLVLEALQGGGAERAEVARRIAETRGLRGSTGILSVQAGRLVRRPFLVRIQGRELVPIGGGAVPAGWGGV
jgi:branched-chain amino acid transport system substrate-binding protein